MSDGVSHRCSPAPSPSRTPSAWTTTSAILHSPYQVYLYNFPNKTISTPSTSAKLRVYNIKPTGTNHTLTQTMEATATSETSVFELHGITSHTTVFLLKKQFGVPYDCAHTGPIYSQRLIFLFYSCCSHLEHRASVQRFVSLQFFKLRR
jgi:hypothetical protein